MWETTDTSEIQFTVTHVGMFSWSSPVKLFEIKVFLKNRVNCVIWYMHISNEYINTKSCLVDGERQHYQFLVEFEMGLLLVCMRLDGHVM